MNRVAIFGAAGAVGTPLAKELDARRVPVRAVGRSREKLERAFGGLANVEVFAADLAEERAAEAAARGVDTIVYSVGLPYPSHHLHPVLMRTTIEAAKRAGVERLVLVSSVYPYGVPRTKRVSEEHPREPHTRKGRYRKEQEDLVLAAHGSGLETLIVRLPDFYGPDAELSLANVVFQAAKAGKTVNWPGPANTLHEFVFTPDTAPVIAELAASTDCYGQAWNFAGPEAINTMDFITRVYRAAGTAPKYRETGPGLLKLIGLFNPTVRELVEMLYLQETPVLLDDSKLLTRFPGTRKTSYDEGIRLTLAKK
jgi:nucleoside-diphosphate-sugar epimerase